MSNLSHSANAEPNLTPILDMVFQLITFFMLVINFQSAQIDASLKLPVIGSASGVKKGGQDVIVLNIDTEGRVKAPAIIDDVNGFITKAAQDSRETATKAGLTISEDDGLPSIVVLRADMFAPFGRVAEVIKICQDHGYQKFSFKAKKEAEKPI